MDTNRLTNINLLSEETLSDIILCDPITRKGIASLNRIGLDTDDITPDFYYNNIRVESKYHKNYTFEELNNSESDEPKCLYYQYTVDRLRFEQVMNQWRRFDSRFYGSQQDGYPLLMLGVAGNGKSIEINRRIYELTSNDEESEPGGICIDLDESFTSITYGETYQCLDSIPCWLFCIKLIDEIMKYIQSCDTKCDVIRNNFYSIIVKKNLATKEKKELFDNIGKYSKEDIDSETKIFQSIKALLITKDGSQNQDIRTLFEIMLLIMYCSNPNKKHYIVIDNIEEYIKLNHLKIQIADSDIRNLNTEINSVVSNIIHDFSRIEKSLGWKAFKIVIVLRRTSLGLLDPARLQAPTRLAQNTTDITGHFQVPEIWAKKKKHIWIDRISKYYNAENNKIINILDRIMNDKKPSNGTNYQALIAPLMSYGIRRNARAQAHASIQTYYCLTKGDNKTIDYCEYEAIMDKSGNNFPASRYMFRRALIEFQFKWSISSDNQDRWRKIGIGHLTGEKECKYNGRLFTVHEVEYYDETCVTLARRILTYLSCFTENDSYVYGQKKTVADMFMTRSLYDLVYNVLIDPSGDNKLTDQDYLQFARVLIALSDMSNEDTKSAPYIILGVNNKEFNDSTDESVLAGLLKDIYNAGSDESEPGKKYNCGDFGARINDAGNSFLLDWQASFSFMASLHCFTIPPLFFLKDITTIKFVIDTVYTASNNLCIKYENEANRFCGKRYNLNNAKYLLKQNNQFVTFRQRIKELHMAHLGTYCDYLEKNYEQLGFFRWAMLDLKDDYIKKYISKYNGWNTTKGEYKCF